MRVLDLAPPIVVLLALLTFGCADDSATLAPRFDGAVAGGATVAAPVDLVTVPVTDGEMTFWPYITVGPGERPHDPVNLVFTGRADPRNIRNALMALGGARPAPFSAFTCTWTDAIGDVQATFGEPVGWTGSVAQLECGDYDPFRFHVRLFPAGDRTLANAHVEILIPGTHTHQVLNWEVAEQFLVFELARAGVLGAAPAQTGIINDAPTMGVIPPQIYNGLPPELRALAGGPAGDVAEPVGIPNDGSATVLHVVVVAPGAPGTFQSLNIVFGQFLPKPFCASPGELVRVDGPLTVERTVTVNSRGELFSEMRAQGDLTVRLVTASGLSDPLVARIRDQNRTELRDDRNVVTSERHHRLIGPGHPTEQLQAQLRIGPHDIARYRSDERCGG